MEKFIEAINIILLDDTLYISVNFVKKHLEECTDMPTKVITAHGNAGIDQ